MSLHLARRRGVTGVGLDRRKHPVGAEPGRCPKKSEDAAQAVGVSGGAQFQPLPPDRSTGAQHYGSSRNPSGPRLLAAGELSFRLNETGEPVLGT